MEQTACHQCAGFELLRKLMSQEPKTEREKLVEIYHSLGQHLDHVHLSASVRQQLKDERARVINAIKAIDAKK